MDYSCGVNDAKRTKDIRVQLNAPQTKILEGATKDELPKSGAHKYLENAHFIFCNPFQSLRLGGMIFLPRNRRPCGLGKAIKVLTQSGVAISHKGCFPHGSSVGSHETRPGVASAGPIIAVLVRCWLGDYGTTMPPTDICVGRG